MSEHNLLTRVMRGALGGEGPQQWHVVRDNETVALAEFAAAGRSRKGVGLEVSMLGDEKPRAVRSSSGLGLSGSVADVAEYAIQELGRNVIQHAWPSRSAPLEISFDDDKTIAIAIADDGIGLAGSLRKFHAPRTDVEAIRLALAAGVTGSVGLLGGDEENAGAGLFVARNLAANLRGSFLLLSGEAVYLQTVDVSTEEYRPVSAKDGSVVASLDPAFSGTAALFFCRPRSTDDMERFFEMIRAAYDEEVRDAAKRHGLRNSFVLASSG